MAKDKLDKLAVALALPKDAKLSDVVASVKTIGVELTLKHRKNSKGDDPEKIYAQVPASSFKVA